MGILDKITNGIGVAFGIIALLALGVASFLFKAWSRTKEELKQEKGKREFERKVVEKNNEAIENIQAQKKKQEVEIEEFEEDVDDSPSILDAVELHNDRVQGPRD